MPVSTDLRQPQGGACAKFVCIRNGIKDVLRLTLNGPFVIGRARALCSYVVNDRLISNVHCKLYAVRSPSGGIIVSCQDFSRNGIRLNGYRISKTAVIIMDGDILELPNSLCPFTCVHIIKEPFEKVSIFDPTPSGLQRKLVHKEVGGYVVMSQCLGTGSFATVHLAFDPANQKQVACKSIRTRREHDVVQVLKEVKILMTLKHPNINEIYDTQEGDSFIHIFLQLCTGGDLFTYISENNNRGERLCEAEAKFIMFQLLKGLAYIHKKHIAHRDLKPENILLYAPGAYPRILIADFGLARPNSYQETMNVCGTVSYLPPEGILALDNQHLGYIGMPADCWSAGIILYIMISGGHPFDNESSYESSIWFNENNNADEVGQVKSRYSKGTYNQSRQARLKVRIVHEQAVYHDRHWSDVPQARLLVQSLLISNYKDRATAVQALHSIWISMDIEQLNATYNRTVTREMQSTIGDS